MCASLNRPAAFPRKKTKKPTWSNAPRPSTTSAYFLTSFPTLPTSRRRRAALYLVIRRRCTNQCSASNVVAGANLILGLGPGNASGFSLADETRRAYDNAVCRENGPPRSTQTSERRSKHPFEVRASADRVDQTRRAPVTATGADAIDQRLSCCFALISHLPRSMERRFRLRHFPIQPVTQPGVKLARGFAFGSLALTKVFDSVLKLGGFGRRFFESTDERRQLCQLVFVQFFHEQVLLPALVLQGFLVVLTICFSTGIHSASLFSVELISLPAFWYAIACLPPHSENMPFENGIPFPVYPLHCNDAEIPQVMICMKAAGGVCEF